MTDLSTKMCFCAFNQLCRLITSLLGAKKMPKFRITFFKVSLSYLEKFRTLFWKMYRNNQYEGPRSFSYCMCLQCIHRTVWNVMCYLLTYIDKRACPFVMIINVYFPKDLSRAFFKITFSIFPLTLKNAILNFGTFWSPELQLYACIVD